MTLEVEFDRSLLGKEHLSGPFTVSEELIRDFCDAVGETDPIHTDEAAARQAGFSSIVAPPTLCTIFVRDTTIPDIKLNFGTRRIHAGQMVEPLAPIVGGDALRGSSYLGDVYPKTGRTGTMVFIVWETSFTNQRGEKVAVVQESFAARE